MLNLIAFNCICVPKKTGNSVKCESFMSFLPTCYTPSQNATHCVWRVSRQHLYLQQINTVITSSRWSHSILYIHTLSVTLPTLIPSSTAPLHRAKFPSCLGSAITLEIRHTEVDSSHALDQSLFLANQHWQQLMHGRIIFIIYYFLSSLLIVEQRNNICHHVFSTMKCDMETMTIALRLDIWYRCLDILKVVNDLRNAVNVDKVAFLILLDLRVTLDHSILSNSLSGIVHD